MVTKYEIIATVGEEAFRREAARLRADAAQDNYGKGAGVISDLAHEVADHIWYPTVPNSEKIQLFFEIYDEMPCYAIVMYSTHFYREFSRQEKLRWWDGVRHRLGSDDAEIRNPIAYSLWCDYFEDPSTVEEAWRAVTSGALNDRLLRCVIKASGPVPYELKKPLYERLGRKNGWREAIFEALVYSAYDHYGQIDTTHARRLLAQLHIPAGTPGLAELEAKLAAA